MVLKLSCPDRPGLVAEITRFLAEAGANLLEMSQFTDVPANWFFMRADFSIGRADFSPTRLAGDLEELGRRLQAEWTLREENARTSAVIFVSKEPHCLLDLQARVESGELPLEVKAVVSNHDALRGVAERGGLPFLHLPLLTDNRDSDWSRYADVLQETESELIVLARFMQILPSALCHQFVGRAINIHHSFLPAFAGAYPYRQAFERGVKIIGATAHYVTGELDCGPIIDQEVSRVEHFHSPADLQRLGRDCECLALARAVRYHCRDRVLLHGNKTIVFRD